MSVLGSRIQVASETRLKGITLGLCFCPLLYLHFRQLWAFQHYQYFPLILLILPLLIRRLRVSRPVESAPASPVRRIHRGLLVLSWGILLFATLGWSPNLAAVAAVITAGAALLWLRSTGRIREGLAVWFLLWTLVRLPLGLDIDLIFWLQGVTSRLSSQILEGIGIDHVLQGHVIRIPRNGFLVEEACSGIQSLFTLIAFTAATLCIVERSVRHSVLLLVAAGFWAALINTLRVTLVVVAAVWFSVDIASGFSHELLGMVLFLAAAMLLVSTDALLGWCFLRANEVAAHREKETVSENSISDFISRAGLSAFLMLAVVQLGVLLLTNSGGDSIDPDDPQIAAAMSRSVLPEHVGDWKLQGYETASRSITNYMGRNSASWTYTTANQTAVVSVDYPFLGWHEVENCYESQGCIVSDRAVLAKNAVQCSVKTPEGARAGLWYSQFTKAGDPLTPLGNNAGTFQYWRSRVQSSLLRQTAAFRGHTGNYQVQLLVSGDIDLTSDQSQELTLFHREMAQRIVSAIQESVQ